MSSGPVQGAPPATGGGERLLQWSDLYGRPKPAIRPERIRYGPASSQVIDLWRPTTPGPHPVVAMIHGGCWTASVANLHIMDWAAGDLAARGIAVWNIEYRRLGEPGAGYPGTYLDVATALDKLWGEADRRKLSTKRGLVVLGHSAGGHLALWAAGRKNVPIPLAEVASVAAPAKVRAVMDLAGLTDLEHDTETSCGADAVAQMAGAPPQYGSTSPAHMLPLGAELYVLHGTQDTTVPISVGRRFAEKARAAGDRVTVLEPPGGHVEEIAPGSVAWEQAAGIVERLVKGERP